MVSAMTGMLAATDWPSTATVQAQNSVLFQDAFTFVQVEY